MQVRFPIQFVRSKDITSFDIEFLRDAFGLPIDEARRLLGQSKIVGPIMVTATAEQLGRWIALRDVRRLKNRFLFPMEIFVKGEPCIHDMSQYSVPGGE